MIGFASRGSKLCAIAATTAAAVGTLVLSQAGAAHHTARATPESAVKAVLVAATSAKLTCSDFNGAGFVNWDILVQLNPNGTARSAAPQGDAYVTGLQAFSVERTDPPTITISNGGRSLHFQGSALLQAGIPNTSFSVSGPSQSCSADFSFPNPQSPVINLVPTS